MKINFFFLLNSDQGKSEFIKLSECDIIKVFKILKGINMKKTLVPPIMTLFLILD